MYLPRLFTTDVHRRALARVLATVLASENSVFVCGPDEDCALVLERAAAEFAQLRARVVQVQPDPAAGLSLPAFMTQVTEFKGAITTFGDNLELVHRILTEPGGDQDMIVLIVSRADLLPAAVIRYIQLARRSGPKLRGLFGGRPRFAEMMDAAEFAYLQDRLSTVSFGTPTALTGGEREPVVTDAES